MRRVVLGAALETTDIFYRMLELSQMFNRYTTPPWPPSPLRPSLPRLRSASAPTFDCDTALLKHKCIKHLRLDSVKFYCFEYRRLLVENNVKFVAVN